MKRLFLLLCVFRIGASLDVSDFYDTDRGVRLENGADKSQHVKLDQPLNFFSDIYDHIYINTPGVLTFNEPMNGFANVPFPLEYATIAPFYSNVDTSNAGPETSISFSTLRTERNNRLAHEAVRRNFPAKDQFSVAQVAVATWENVGHYRENNTDQNTFQVAIISGEQDTFVQYLYPSNGLNWLQGDFGETGLPDIRAQSGFVAEDGRSFALPGSGTENAKYLSQLSNHGVPGSWIFRVGHIEFENNVESPEQSDYEAEEAAQPRSCEEGGRLKCHVPAICQNNQQGFGCQCKPGFYGNGIECIKNDIPLRVAGRVTGQIRVADINAQIQSYVVLNDGRSYTAISPISAHNGYSAQLAYTFGYAIGWLFAKPIGTDNTPNGYQITGGKFNNTISVRFLNEVEANNELLIVQRFTGLNVWDQLSVDIDVKGNLPDVSPDATIEFPDANDAYVFESEKRIRSDGVGFISLDGRNVSYSISQLIEFERPYGSQSDGFNPSPIYNKVSKISSHYQSNEQALRIGMINRVVRNTPVNPCTDGSAQCGPNSICIPDPDQSSYTCECRNGFISDENEVCVDVDECSSNANICDENAYCQNDLGGYNCQCYDGFYGNGYKCYPQERAATSETPAYESTTDYTPSIPALAPNHWLCDQCSEHSYCNEGVCVCKNGWNGNGVECVYNCQEDYVWNVDRCVPINPSTDDDEREVPPFCHMQGCTCPTGYELIDTEDPHVCRLVEVDVAEDDKLPCDVENTCHHNANCMWVESELRNKCVCNPGYEGTGYECAEQEVSCLFENICDVHASCIYDEQIGKSVCRCDKRYEGDGKSCQLAPECAEDTDCSQNAQCSDGVCLCNEGFERDGSDDCVPSGYCGGTFCATNAVCLWDHQEHIQYCACPEPFIGDGIQYCRSIPPTCNVKNNCGLNAQCLPVNETYECKCNIGFYGDGFICVPERTCNTDPAFCHEFGRCVSTKAGYQCICNSGYIGNGTHCAEPVRETTGFLLLSHGIATVKIPFDGKGGAPIATSSMAIGVDKDCATGRVFWSDISTQQIYSAKYDGSERQVFIDQGVVSPEGVAVDWISRRIYWTDSSKDTIEVASLDDSSKRATIIKTGLVNPRGIAVDPHSSKLYWSDWNRAYPKIEQSDLDGTNRVTILEAPAINLPNLLAISTQTGELCFADAGTHKVECIEPYHKTTRTVATNLTYPFGLAIADERLYWTDWTTKRIEVSDNYGTRFPALSSVLFGNHKMYGMAAVTSDCPLFFSPCQVNNGDCPSDSICLINPNAPSGKRCQPIS